MKRKNYSGVSEIRPVSFLSRYWFLAMLYANEIQFGLIQAYASRLFIARLLFISVMHCVGLL